LNAIKKGAAFYQSPKIVILKTGHRCVAGLDKMGYVTMQSVYNLHITTLEIAYEALLALLNSRFVHCFIYKTFTSYKSLFPQLNQSTLQAIPVPLNIHDKQNELMTLVQNIQYINEKLKNAKTLQEENFLRIQFESIDRTIDQLIYNLYRLTPEEINVIERNVI